MPTQAEVADWLGVSTRVVREWIARGVIPNPQTAELRDIVRAYAAHARAQAAGRRGSDPNRDLATERTRLTEAQRIDQELRNAERSGELLRRVDVVETWALRISACKAKLRGLARVSVLRLGLSKKQAQGLLALIDEALHELAGDGVPRLGARGRRVARGR